jgi:hypothetical protein
MKTYGKLFRTGVFISILSIFACVTINIYFPAEKVESVAGEIVEEIRGPQSENEEDSNKNDQSSFIENNLYALFVSVAWAEEITTISNPTIRTLKNSMKDRFGLLKPYFQKGILFEGNNGYVSIKDAGKLGLKERRNLKNLVDAENKDRTHLYQEVAKALNIDDNQIDKIATIFAKEWQKSLY